MACEQKRCQYCNVQWTVYHQPRILAEVDFFFFNLFLLNYTHLHEMIFRISGSRNVIHHAINNS